MAVGEFNRDPVRSQILEACERIGGELGLVCSPSVIIGEPVASNSAIVSESALSQAASNSASDIRLVARLAKASMRYPGRGTLPIGSVGIAMARPFLAWGLGPPFA